MSELEEPTQSKGISRRTVTTAIAWAVPAIAIAAPVPAFAASGPSPTAEFLYACKNPGGSCSTRKFGYSFYFDITNNTGKDIYIYSPIGYDVTILSGPDTPFNWAQGSPALPALVGDGDTVTIEFVAQNTNSANRTFTANLTIPWGHTLPNGSDTDHMPITPPTISVLGTPPNCPCPPA